MRSVRSRRNALCISFLMPHSPLSDQVKADIQMDRQHSTIRWYDFIDNVARSIYDDMWDCVRASASAVVRESFSGSPDEER